MSLRRIISAALLAAALGAILALPVGAERRVSVRIWFVIASLLLCWTFLRQLITATPAPPSRSLTVASWWYRRSDAPRPSGTSDLRSTEALFFRLRNNPRPHVRQLRPRLVAVAAHNLAMQHGIDLSTDADEVDQVLGDLGWLIDPAVVDRAPTMAEVDAFLDVIASP